MESKEPSQEEIAKWDRWFACEFNDLSWNIAENPGTAANSPEIETMLHAAYAAAFHWTRVGNELNRALADMSLGQAHALAGEGTAAMKYARRSLEFFSSRDSKDWEIAFAHAVLANAARAAGETAVYEKHRAIASELREKIADAEDREIFDRTYDKL